MYVGKRHLAYRKKRVSGLKLCAQLIEYTNNVKAQDRTREAYDDERLFLACLNLIAKKLKNKNREKKRNIKGGLDESYKTKYRNNDGKKNAEAAHQLVASENGEEELENDAGENDDGQLVTGAQEICSEKHTNDVSEESSKGEHTFDEQVVNTHIRYESVSEEEKEDDQEKVMGLKKELCLEKEKYSVLEEKHSVLEEKHSVLEEKHSVLEEKHSVLEEKHSVLEEKGRDSSARHLFTLSCLSCGWVFVVCQCVGVSEGQLILILFSLAVLQFYACVSLV